MNADELIILQYELIARKSQHVKVARENYQKCIMLVPEKVTCFRKVIEELREAGTPYDTKQFDAAVKENCCEFCQAGWGESKAIKEIKKKLTALKRSMHALAKRLLNERKGVQSTFLPNTTPE